MSLTTPGLLGWGEICTDLAMVSMNPNKAASGGSYVAHLRAPTGNSLDSSEVETRAGLAGKHLYSRSKLRPGFMEDRGRENTFPTAVFFTPYEACTCRPLGERNACLSWKYVWKQKLVMLEWPSTGRGRGRGEVQQNLSDSFH